MELKLTLKSVHDLFDTAHIDHALIGGLGLACYGSTRSKVDLDLLIHEADIQFLIETQDDLKWEVINEIKTENKP